MSLNEVEEVSKETIKPLSPTPDHLQNYHLCILDQIAPPIFIPITLFYPPPTTSATSDHEHHLKMSNKLKKSLSETLTRFYPVAGRIKGNNNMFVECNDEGIDYIEARAKGSISNFMKRDALHHLLPANIDLLAGGIVNNGPQLIVKVTIFDCCGIAICICISHKIADASSLITFINSWASIARVGAMDNDIDTNYPTFDLSILHPPKEEVHARASTSKSSTKTTDHNDNQPPPEIISSRRLVFDATKIAALRAKYGGPSNQNYPTRVEAVSTLLWKTAMAASSSRKPSVAMFTVNMRKRMDPPLPPQAFGNFVIVTTTSPVMKESISPDIELLCTIKETMSGINGEYVKAMQGDEGVLKLQEKTIDMISNGHKNMEIYNFSSWCRLPLYECDFGLAKPIWVTGCAFKPFKNMFILMDSNNSTGEHGIEVYVGLVEEEMAIFELDQELLKFVSLMD